MSVNRIHFFRAAVVRIFHNAFAAWLILGTSLFFTAVAYYFSLQAAAAVVRDRFEHRADEAVLAIKSRMEVYESVLRGAAGLFDASEFVSREEFRRYVDSLELESRWPGIQGIGFAVPLKPEDVPTHLTLIRAEGFPEYDIVPRGSRDFYTAIIYLEPFDWRNQRAFGFDMWSNDVRRAAMRRARDTGLPSSSGIITLVQETDQDRQKGFLTYHPIYRNEVTAADEAGRQSAFMGWVYAPFRVNDLMKGVIGSADRDLHFAIYDSDDLSEENRLFSTDDVLPVRPDFAKQVRLDIQGRSWTVEFRAPEGTVASQSSETPTYVAVAAGMVDLLLFYVIYSIQYLNKKARSIAGVMTAELKDKSLALQQTKDELERKLRDLETAQAKLIESSNLAGLGEMAGGIAHEINNPLTIIYGYLDRLLLLSERHRLTDDETKQIVGAAQKTVFRIRGIVNGLRNFSRDSQHESIAPARIGDIIEETMALCREKFRKNGVEMKVTGTMDTEIACRKIQVSQVLVNLLNNSFHAVRNALVKDIEIDCRTHDGYLTLAVTDSGEGIPNDQRHKVFQPFFTTKEVGQGTGLGLSISKGLIESQNGTLELDPDSVRTRFVVRLPLQLNLKHSA